jgi:hypothetical protein
MEASDSEEAGDMLGAASKQKMHCIALHGGRGTDKRCIVVGLAGMLGVTRGRWPIFF